MVGYPQDIFMKPTETVLAAKTIHVGALFGHVSNGGGIIKLNDFVGIRIIALNEKFRQIQVIVPATDEPIQSQTWLKATKTSSPNRPALSETRIEMVKDVECEELL